MADADSVRDSGISRLLTPVQDPEPAPAARPPQPTPGEMSLVGHLTELRNRIFRMALAVAIMSIVGFLFGDQIVAILKAPIPVDPTTHQAQPLFYTGLGDAFMIKVKIALVVGMILSMPVILWQVWGFISPGLTPAERRVVRPWLPAALVFFAIGTSIAYFILPFAAGFLIGFSSQDLKPLITAGSYFDFVTTLFLVFGLIMEFPILLYGLSRVGIVTSQRLTAARRPAILGIAIFATAITPGGDLVSPTVLGLTMYVLFEGTIFFIRRSGK
jgi:sec-independent protein translocase protein TatC